MQLKVRLFGDLGSEPEVLLATLRFMVLGDGDGAAVIVGLYNGDEELHRASCIIVLHRALENWVCKPRLLVLRLSCACFVCFV